MKQEEYIISVAEPWDFECQDGQNIIRGNILSKKSNQCLVFKSNYHLRFGEVEGNIFVLVPRYSGINFSSLGDEKLSFNGSILLSEYSELLGENELFEKSKFVIIGSFNQKTK